jgi:hypothetical protein
LCSRLGAGRGVHLSDGCWIICSHPPFLPLPPNHRALPPSQNLPSSADDEQGERKTFRRRSSPARRPKELSSLFAEVRSCFCFIKIFKNLFFSQ